MYYVALRVQPLRKDVHSQQDDAPSQYPNTLKAYLGKSEPDRETEKGTGILAHTFSQ